MFPFGYIQNRLDLGTLGKTLDKAHEEVYSPVNRNHREAVFTLFSINNQVLRILERWQKGDIIVRFVTREVTENILTDIPYCITMSARLRDNDTTLVRGYLLRYRDLNNVLIKYIHGRNTESPCHEIKHRTAIDKTFDRWRVIKILEQLGEIQKELDSYHGLYDTQLRDRTGPTRETIFRLIRLYESLRILAVSLAHFDGEARLQLTSVEFLFGNMGRRIANVCSHTEQAIISTNLDFLLKDLSKTTQQLIKQFKTMDVY